MSRPVIARECLRFLERGHSKGVKWCLEDGDVDKVRAILDALDSVEEECRRILAIDYRNAIPGDNRIAQRFLDIITR